MDLINNMWLSINYSIYISYDIKISSLFSHFFYTLYVPIDIIVISNMYFIMNFLLANTF